jgi:hypothetical protein
MAQNPRALAQVPTTSSLRNPEDGCLASLIERCTYIMMSQVLELTTRLDYGLLQLGQALPTPLEELSRVMSLEKAETYPDQALMMIPI